MLLHMRSSSLFFLVRSSFFNFFSACKIYEIESNSSRTHLADIYPSPHLLPFPRVSSYRISTQKTALQASHFILCRMFSSSSCTSGERTDLYTKKQHCKLAIFFYVECFLLLHVQVVKGHPRKLWFCICHPSIRNETLVVQRISSFADLI